MTVIKNEVRDAIAKELAAAEQAHGLHHSAAETYAVMLEELEEAEEELQACRAHLARLWHGVRLDRSDMVDGHAARLAYAAELAACGCIQLAAMARKGIKPPGLRVPFAGINEWRGAKVEEWLTDLRRATDGRGTT